MHELVSKALFLSQTEHLSAKLAQRRGWLLHVMEYPTLDLSFTAEGRTPLRLRTTCENWNDQPPSFRLLAADGSALRACPPSPAPPEIHPNPSGIFNASPHPATGAPFVCMRGSREYHTHPSHLNDQWDTVRQQSGYDIGGILTQIWHGWLKGSG